MTTITKGELLTALGADASKFTSFMIDPSAFGVTEPYISMLKVAKQQFDWTASIDLDLPEIQQLIGLLKLLGAITDDNIAALYQISADTKYLINVIAQDSITATNIYGAIEVEGLWQVRIDFLNHTKGETISEIFVFDYIPLESDIQLCVNIKVKELRQIK